MQRIPWINQLCREYIVLDILKKMRLSSFLEVGIGDGHLLQRMARLGFHGKGIDLSPQAIDQANGLLGDLPGRIILECTDLYKVKGEFDLILLLQVMEHIEDDRLALCALKKLLPRGGYVLLSVPAHKNQWGYLDLVGGHYRRYERDGLKGLLTSAGFTPLCVYSLGVPVLNWMRAWDEMWYKQYFYNHGLDNKSISERTMESAFVTVPWVLAFPSWVRVLINEATLLPLLELQKLFLNSDRGLNYLVLAQA